MPAARKPQSSTPDVSDGVSLPEVPGNDEDLGRSEVPEGNADLPQSGEAPSSSTGDNGASLLRQALKFHLMHDHKLMPHEADKKLDGWLK